MLALFGLVAFAWLGTSSTFAPTTASPTLPTTQAPTLQPTTAAPSLAPTTGAPGTTAPSSAPTSSPTISPTVSWENIALSTIEMNLTCGMRNVAYRQFEKMTPPLCIVIDDVNYIAFYPNVDDFTLLEVQQSFGTAWLDNPQNEPVYIRAEVGAKSSYWRTRSQGLPPNKITVPFWTLVIEVTDGLVDKLTWDDSCPLCESSDMCVADRNCGVMHNTCGNTDADNNCNLQIYVSWFGTDADGKYFTSSDKRLSRFRSGSLRGAYDSALKKANNIATIANPVAIGR